MAGEMFKEDLDENGDFYSVRLDFERLMSLCGIPKNSYQTKPFDVFQGPYLEINGFNGRIWAHYESSFIFLVEDFNTGLIKEFSEMVIPVVLVRLMNS